MPSIIIIIKIALMGDACARFWDFKPTITGCWQAKGTQLCTASDAALAGHVTHCPSSIWKAIGDWNL